jgi:hypothetical protein
MTKQLKLEIAANKAVCKLIIRTGQVAQEAELDKALNGLSMPNQIAVLHQMALVFAGAYEGLCEADATFATSTRSEARRQLATLAVLEAKSA